MNNYQKEKTASIPSVGADERQPIKKDRDIIISDDSSNFNDSMESFEDYFKKYQESLDPLNLNTISMTELFGTVYESKPPIIEGLLYPGTYLFVGSPKLGKSFFMAQLAYHVSTGTSLWGYPVRKGTVLYLALEDDYVRLQERLYRMFGAAENGNLFLCVNAAQLGSGLNEQLDRFIEKHPDTSLIIIDTLQKVRELNSENFSYGNDYQIINSLKQFTDAKGICLLLVHHTRKQRADDSFEMISGTNGLLGAADGAFILRKEKRTSANAVLEISGRDQQEQKLYIRRNEQTLAWELEKVETDLWKAAEEPILAEISSRINEDHPSWKGSPTELCSFLGTELKPNVLSMKLNINANTLLRKYHIRYRSTRTHNGRLVSLNYEAP